ncbi:MAG: 16S rRNA (cytosine(1402)-N(4))-methyltransferase RsmH [Acidobacteria bacterium]|nr:16S rRNA (cytosine(1402)-N(4))-methyltransferase RsmH [Acidobacteriota bacterium]
MTNGRWHTPVLVAEVLHWLAVRPTGVYLDATIGTGGHAEAILARLTTGRLIGMDRDSTALEIAQERLRPYAAKLTLVEDTFARLAEIQQRLSLGPLDGVLADLGVSSLQLGAPERGFSFQRAGPLDMRMNSQDPRTAADLVNRLPEGELAELLRRYGEERAARKIARAIVRTRPLRDTLHLAQVVAGTQHKGRQKLHPATRTFLALRIAVNRELEELEQFLHRVPATLKSGGRIVVLTYHSLEDRLVKQAFRAGAAERTWRILTRKPVRPSTEEVRANPRARSAKLRAAEMVSVN